MFVLLGGAHRNTDVVVQAESSEGPDDDAPAKQRVVVARSRLHQDKIGIARPHRVPEGREFPAQVLDAGCVGLLGPSDVVFVVERREGCGLRQAVDVEGMPGAIEVADQLGIRDSVADA